MRTAVKIFAALILLLISGAGGALLVLPESTLHALPGGEGKRLVSIKRDAREGITYWFEDALYEMKSLIWNLTNGDFFVTGADVEFEIPLDVRKQIRQGIKQPKVQPSSASSKTPPRRKSQAQTEAVPAPTKAVALPIRTPPALQPTHTAPKREIERESILARAAERVDPLVTGAVHEKADHMSPGAVMANPIPEAAFAMPPPVAKISSRPKTEASKKMPVLAKAAKLTIKPALLKAKTPEKSPALTKMKKPMPTEPPKTRPSLALAKQHAKAKAKKPKQVVPLPAKPEAQSSTSEKKSHLPSLPSPTPKPKPDSSPMPVMQEKPRPAATKQPAAASKNGADEHKRGMLHYRGNTVAKSLTKAAKWFRIAAKNGHVGAQYNLGIMAFLGQGMTKDYEKAAKWFRMAGEQDHAAAQYNLGFLYYVGRGVAKDDVSAFNWIDRAANLGDKKARRARDTLRETLPPEILLR